jgi:excinuclease ABC subunit C
VLGRERRTLKGTADRSEAEIYSAFIQQYYMRADVVPPQVVSAVEPEDRELVQDWLGRKAGRSVELRVPRKGPLVGLIRLALRNARLDLEEGQGNRRRRTIAPAVYELQSVLDLKLPPVRIECFDISNIQGSHPVASLVVMVNGTPTPSEYRRYRMKTPGPDDFAMMREVVFRRASRITANEIPAPDLIVIDGGKGQVGAAIEALTDAGLTHVPVIGLAKREEEIHIPGVEEPLRLPRNAPALRILIQLRDEAHRFAIRFHRSLRSRAALRSRLDDVPGIGEQRRLSLLQFFGSMEAVEKATESELARAPGFGPSTARRLYQALHGERAAS